MRINIIGAGALGGLYGAMLAREGQDVHFLMRSDYEVVKARGLKVRSVWGDFTLDPVQVYHDPDELPPADLVLVGLKTTANEHYERLLSASMAGGGWVLTLQNGLGNEEALAELFGPERVAGGVAFLCSNRIAPGEIHHSNYGAIEIGEYDRPPSDRLRELAAIFEAAGVPCAISDDLRATRWRKQVWNVPFNAVTALTGGSDTEAIVTDPPMRGLVERVMREVQSAAASVGVTIDDSFLTDRMEHTDNMGPYITSMALDYLHGRAMEVEAIVGSVVRTGRANGVDVSATATIYALLAQLDRKFQQGKDAR